MRNLARVVVVLIAVFLWVVAIGCFISVGWRLVGYNAVFPALFAWALALLLFFGPFAMMEERKD